MTPYKSARSRAVLLGIMMLACLAVIACRWRLYVKKEPTKFELYMNGTPQGSTQSALPTNFVPPPDGDSGNSK